MAKSVLNRSTMSCHKQPSQSNGYCLDLVIWVKPNMTLHYKVDMSQPRLTNDQELGNPSLALTNMNARRPMCTCI